ncbi:hypothetical protein CEUSTIGMA_g7090.t1 [Chlamydomonas eustigma]|uniref:AB hydrolase-1 domain-containing protein n=1 Tax=Chlamydomonas eustigma TaxID=1157962 RepID=A0A250X9T0_9CHLO|nr:hypothetical protein CEUSTIGMA_g7090.t1 [Chlamydomonas eustigma]|eukprot:GAX79649.1 hypothetical protein CEUSTIGMA_g7090.t1 [Chlamydomonas eustigma]
MDLGLQYELIQPEGVCTNRAALVFHPWSWLGGSMWDPVVTSFTRAAVKSGLFSMVVRYNMRGTGKSAGFKSLSATTDAEDASKLCKHILTKMRERHSHYPEASPEDGSFHKGSPSGNGGSSSTNGSAVEQEPQLVLLAYSYGSCVASHLLNLCPQVSVFVSVGYPLGMLSRFFLGSQSSWEALMEHGVRAGRPCLLFLGDQDQFTGVDTLQGLVDHEMRGNNAGGEANMSEDVATSSNTLKTQAENEKLLKLIIIPGCDHFFHGDLDEHVAEDTMKWLRENCHV